MKTIAPYIDLGWHTVPLKGELKRLDDGTKTIPEFPKDWRTKYQLTKNTTATPLGGAITGEVSNIIAIDCDNDVTYELFLSLDPQASFIFESKGKGKNCGTLIYEYTEELTDSFSINDGEVALDVYSNRGFIYLATEANRTKFLPTQPLVEPGPMPLTTLTLLKQLAKKQAMPTPTASTNVNIMTANCQAPLVTQFADGDFLPGLFKVLTPKDFREEPAYVLNGYLHPSEVPAGRGSEYLMKVSAILGADISVDHDLYARTMVKINKLFKDPMKVSRLEKTIMDPMLTGASSIDGVPIWKYDSAWRDHRLILSSKRQSSLELCFDDQRNTYYVVDAANIDIKTFGRDSELMSYIEAAAVSAPKKIEVKRSLPIANVQAVPNLPFGFNPGKDPTARLLNTFVATPELMVFNNPEAYMSKYKHPTNTLKYLETLVPDKVLRDYLLQFVHTKLKTFNYSPVVLYFMGAHGSGKDLFVQLLERIIGSVARPTTREFLEMFNGWLLDQYFVQLDEYGNQLQGPREREEALGKIKAYTGKQRVQIRQMRTDGFMYDHHATFIMTANKNPLMVEEGDRRICFLPTPNVLAEADWVLSAGGVATVYNSILAETKDFCYYLATEVKQLSASAYVKPPVSEDKNKLIADSMHAAQRIAFVLKHNMQDYFYELVLDHLGEARMTEIKNSYAVLTTDLADLYDEMTEFKGDPKTLMKHLRSANLNLAPTTKDGVKCYKVKTFEHNPFEADEDEN